MKSIELVLQSIEVLSTLPEADALTGDAKKLFDMAVSQAAKARTEMESGKLVVTEMKEYWIFWMGSKKASKAFGDSIEGAFASMGYGGGAVRGIDFYVQVPARHDLIQRTPTMPENAEDRRMVVDHYLQGITAHFSELKETGTEEDYIVALSDFGYAYDKSSSIVVFPEMDEFNALFQKLLQEFDPQTVEGKGCVEDWTPDSQAS